MVVYGPDFTQRRAAVEYDHGRSPTDWCPVAGFGHGLSPGDPAYRPRSRTAQGAPSSRSGSAVGMHADVLCRSPVHSCHGPGASSLLSCSLRRFQPSRATSATSRVRTSSRCFIV